MYFSSSYGVQLHLLKQRNSILAFPGSLLSLQQHHTPFLFFGQSFGLLLSVFPNKESLCVFLLSILTTRPSPRLCARFYCWFFKVTVGTPVHYQPILCLIWLRRYKFQYHIVGWDALVLSASVTSIERLGLVGQS